MVANIQPEKISSYPTGAADPKPMIPWPPQKIIENEASTSRCYQYII